MALDRPRVADFVKETTDTEGLGAFTLAGPVPGFRSFSVLSDGAKVYYSVVDNPDAITDFEQGIGTYTAGSPATVSRDRVISSSNGNARVSWAPGTKTVIITAAAELLNAILDTVDSDLKTTGTATAYSLTTYRPDVGLFEGRFVCAKFHVANGASPTLDVDGTGGKAIVDINGSTPPAGSMPASYYFLKYDATAGKWVVFSPFNMGTASSKNLGADIIDDGSGNLTATELLAVKTGSYTLVSGDRRKHFYFAITAGATCTVPSAAISGNRWSAKISNAPNSSDALQVTSASGNFYGGSITNSATLVLYPGESCVITSTGTIWVISAWQRNVGKTFAYGSFKAATSATIRTGTATDEAATPAALKTNIRPLLATLTASNSASLAFTGFDSTKYAGYEVYFEQLLPGTTSVKLDVYVSTDGGSSYLSSGYEWNVLRCDLANAAGNGSNADSKARLVADLDVSNAIPLSGFMIVSIGSGAYNFSYNGSMRYRPSNFVSNQFAGTNTSSTIINAIKWQFSSGNIASGVVRVYGIPK